MPTYELLCRDCKAEFEVVASLSEYERMKREGTVQCTACGSTNVVPEIVSFQTRAERKSA